MPRWAFGLMVAGGLWLCLWTTPIRLLGLVPALLGAAAAAMSPRPDLLVTGDGRHLAVVGGDGRPLLLRERAGDYVRSLLSEASAFDGEPAALAKPRRSAPARATPASRSSPRAGRNGGCWRPARRNGSTGPTLTRACADADIVVSSRRLPRGCTPRWLKLDREALERTGGVAIYLDDPPRTATVAERVGRHPWAS